MESLLPPFVTSLTGGDLFILAFLFLVFFGFTLPIPEEAALVLVGLTLRSAGYGFLETLSLSILALTLADVGYYSAARFLGARLLRSRLGRAILKPGKVEEAQRYLARRGPRILFITRFVVGLRSAAILGAGFLGFPFKRFMLFNSLALCICAATWLGLGYFLGSRIERYVGTMERVLSIVGALSAIALTIGAYILVSKRVKAHREKSKLEERQAA